MASLRIISGSLGGRILRLPDNLPARPTMDKTKQALFNILANRLDFEDCDMLDLCTGTGNIALECFSRGMQKIVAVDKDKRCVAAVKKLFAEFGVSQGSVHQSDILSYVEQCNLQFDFIFMDPPYALPRQAEILERIWEKNLVKEGGILVLEHQQTLSFATVSHYQDTRVYGGSALSFFEK